VLDHDSACDLFKRTVCTVVSLVKDSIAFGPQFIAVAWCNALCSEACITTRNGPVAFIHAANFSRFPAQIPSWTNKLCT
jgi:hypothetical protein